jgi:hypothetical protein
MIGKVYDLRLMSSIKRAKNVPAMWLVQGTQDTIVSLVFVTRLEDK